MSREPTRPRGVRVLQLRYFPDPVLLRKASPIAVVDDAVRRGIDEMTPLMELEQGIGLAAPQVGWSVRLLLASPDGDKARPVVLVNPSIVKKSGGEWGEEGCLSFPGIYGEVLRATKILVRAEDRDGKPAEFEAEGLYARVLQHEIDHLDGILFVSKMRPADKKAAQKKLEDLRARYEAGKSVAPHEA